MTDLARRNFHHRGIKQRHCQKKKEKKKTHRSPAKLRPQKILQLFSVIFCNRVQSQALNISFSPTVAIYWSLYKDYVKCVSVSINNTCRLYFMIISYNMTKIKHFHSQEFRNPSQVASYSTYSLSTRHMQCYQPREKNSVSMASTRDLCKAIVLVVPGSRIWGHAPPPTRIFSPQEGGLII